MSFERKSYKKCAGKPWKDNVTVPQPESRSKCDHQIFLIQNQQTLLSDLLQKIICRYIFSSNWHIFHENKLLGHGVVGLQLLSRTWIMVKINPTTMPDRFFTAITSHLCDMWYKYVSFPLWGKHCLLPMSELWWICTLWINFTFGFSYLNWSIEISFSYLVIVTFSNKG